MRIAAHLGVPVAAVETAVIGKRKLLVVERYDRIVRADGVVERIHQEDFCQATATVPDNKYEEDGGPSLLRVAGLLQTVAASDAIEDLLKAVTINALIGNGDAHAKNYSILHQLTGTLTLAPLYDLLCTLYYGDDRLAMYIDSVHRTNRVTVQRIAKEALKWGMSTERAMTIVLDLLEGAPAAIAAARDETEGVSEEMVSTIEGQLARLRSSE
jgi:serine/threonine-protein kinase HipA